MSTSPKSVKLITLSLKSPVYWILILLLLISPNEFAAHNSYVEESDSKNSISTPDPDLSIREVSGYVTGYGQLLSNALVMVKHTSRQTVTDEKGYYSIRAAQGEILMYSYMGMKTMEVIVEDITKKLDINLVTESRMLDEVKLGASDNSVYLPDTINSYFGNIERKKLGVSSYYVAGEDLNLGAIDLVESLVGKVPGYNVASDTRGVKRVYFRSQVPNSRQGALWDIDGILYEGEPPYIDLNTIESVNVIKSPGGIARYGSLGVGGVIIVRTENQVFARSRSSRPVSASFTNKNFYSKDAVSIKSQAYVKPSYWSTLNSVNSREDVLDAFERYLPVFKDESSFYLDFASKLYAYGYDERSISRVLEAMGDNLFYDPVALKSLAYFYQEKGKKREALKTYLRILSLRPEYAQSYRDLANAYRSVGFIEKAWSYYMNYLNKVEKLDENGIGEIIYHEMEEIHFRRPMGFRPVEAFVSKTELKDIPKDARLVFEWDNSEAEFELEFVNPEGQAYSFIHTYEYNNEQIIDEKNKGYSSREFIIDDLLKKGWMVNITYFGNKSENPTYFKATIIEKWAQRGQKEKVILEKLVEKHKKFNLLQL